MSTADQTATWMRRRASNVYGRPAFLAKVGGVAFVVAVLSFFSLARAASLSEGRATRSRAGADTAALDSLERRANARLHATESALAAARAQRRSRVLTSDVLTPAARARRDSLAAAAAEITRLLVRSDDAPLVASFRALGSSAPMSGAPHIAQLLDSLNDLDKARSDFGSSDGVDPIFVALTARVGAIGHEIEAAARARRAEFRREIDSMTPTPVIGATIDTAPLVAARDSAERGQTAVAQRAAAARNADSIARERDDDSPGMFGVGAATIVLAALVVAIVAALAIALMLELQRPRIADVAEAEALSGARVLVTIGERSDATERQRRSADHEVPPSIEQSSDSYRLLYGQLADATFDLTVIAVTGDHPFVTVSVAANLAAIAARTGRPTLLLDTDFREQPVAKMMGVAETPGVADVLAQRLGWAGAISSVVVSRGRSIDVLPSGVLVEGGTLQAVAEEFGSEVERLSRRYETVVVSASTPEQGTIGVAAGAVSDVVICVRRGRSTHAALRALLAALESSGATMRGLVFWDRADPAPVLGWPAGDGAAGGKRLELLG